jgi:hypothetical protein
MPIELPHRDKAEGDPFAHHPKRDLVEWFFMGIGILLKGAGWLAAIFFGHLTLGGLVSNRLFGLVAAIYCFPAF